MENVLKQKSVRYGLKGKDRGREIEVLTDSKSEVCLLKRRLWKN